MNLMNYEPIATDGKVLIDKAVFEELRANYVRAQILAGIEESRQQIREGKKAPSDEVFARLQKKYGF